MLLARTWRYFIKVLITHCYFVTCKTKVLARFNCAIFNSHNTWRKNFVNVFTITSEARVFLCHYISAPSSPLRHK